MAVSKKQQEIKPVEERISDVEYSDVMRKSYLDYSMSVIVARAIPDIRDSLKPVQRRILYDMSELGTTHDKPYRKSARITGDTMGKYHPHGDSSIYDALVVMSQDFKKGITLVDGHGNFGSIEGDGAAAQRYTEARLREYSEKIFLEYLNDGTVEFVPNYDETEKEPEVLPCRLPNFLINGSEGIAVGMATSTPPHNLSDVADTALYYLDHPDASSAELLGILKGPDFPTGGIVSNKSDLPEIYETGTGKIKIRGKVQFEPGKSGEKDRLVITEIPYTMVGDGISKFLQSVADLVENKTLPEITDITNQISKDGIRIVLELKKGADCQYIENMLYKKTRLEDTFGVNMLAVSKGKPEVMGLKEVMKAYAEFQFDINTKRYASLLRKTNERLEVLEGLIRAVDEMDTIIEVLRGSRTVKQSKDCFVNGITDGINFRTKGGEKAAKKLGFTEVQADAILSMRLSRLVGLETEELKKEYDKKQKLKAQYEKILSNEKEMRKAIKKDILLLKEEFGYERKTEIMDVASVEIAVKEEAEADVAVLIDKFFYIHAIDAGTYLKNADAVKEEYRCCINTTNKSKIVLFCDKGKAHVIKVSDIPFGKLRDKGKPIDNISNYDSRNENIVGAVAVNAENPLYIFLTSDGFIKITDVSEFDVTRKTVDATKLKDGSRIVAVSEYIDGGSVVIGTNNGMFIRFKQDEIPVQKKNATGAVSMKLAENDEVSCMYTVNAISDTISINGAEMEASRIKGMRRGGKGTKIRV